MAYSSLLLVLCIKSIPKLLLPDEHGDSMDIEQKKSFLVKGYSHYDSSSRGNLISYREQVT